MAERPVFHVIDKAPFYERINTEFTYYPGFAVSQKHKSIQSLHKSYLDRYPDRKILEASSKGNDELGIGLSAFNIEIKKNGHIYKLESVFQGSKVFEDGNGCHDLYDAEPIVAKKDERVKSGKPLKCFDYFGEIFPLEPKDYFYNWIYINALKNRIKGKNSLCDYDSFTDIEFNPNKSINCQAIASAIYVGLCRNNLIDEALKSKEDFLRVVYNRQLEKASEQLSFF